MKNIYINGRITEDTYTKIVKETNSLRNQEEVYIHIDSMGGNVNAGIKIYRHLLTLDPRVVTVAKKAQSIASIIFLAGESRIVVDELKEPILAHLPRLPKDLVEGTAEKLKSTATFIQSMEDEMIDIYSVYLIDKSKEEIKELLREDRGLTAKEAVALGLATAIEQPLEAVAEFEQIVPTKQKNNIMKDFLKVISDFVAKHTVAVYQVLTADGVELVFPDVEDREPVVGDKVNNEEGDYLMPDGSTWTILGGKLDAIVEAEQPEEEVEEEEEVVEAIDSEDEAVTEVIEEVEEELPGLAEAFQKFVTIVTDRMDALEARLDAIEGASTEVKEDIKKELEEQIVAIKGAISGGGTPEDVNQPKSWIHVKPNRIK